MKEIYALGFDYDSIENVVYLSLNTKEDYLKTIQEYKLLPYMADTLSSENGMRSVEFHPGNWRHVAFDDCKPLSEEELATWRNMNNENTESYDIEKWNANYVALQETIFLALIEYSKCDEVKLLPIISELYIIAIDHDESFEKAENLFLNFKKQVELKGLKK